MLLMLQHSRHAFIKFLRLLVPHILRGDADPTVEDSLEPEREFFPLVPIFLIYILPKSIILLTLALIH